MAAIEDIISLATETELRLAEARELVMGAQQVLKQYNAKWDGGLDGELFQEAIKYINKARQALPGEIID